MNSLLVERRNPIYQLSHAGLKGDTYGWPCSRAQERGEKESLPLLQKCLGFLKQSQIFLIQKWLTEGRIYSEGEEGCEPPRTELSGEMWMFLGVWYSPQQPWASATGRVWHHTFSAAIQGLLCSSRRVQSTVNIPVSLRGCSSVLHSL